MQESYFSDIVPGLLSYSYYWGALHEYSDDYELYIGDDYHTVSDTGSVFITSYTFRGNRE